MEGRRYRLDGAIDDGLASRCGVNTKTFDPSLTVAALRGAALQRCSSFLVQCENPLYRSFGARGFLFAFLLACLCELHRIRIVQAEMGLAGSRTSFSFPPNRKPSFLSAIFCICHHVCPLVHPILPVTAFGWQFLYRGCVFVVTVFLLGNFASLATFRGRHSLHGERRVHRQCDGRPEICRMQPRILRGIHQMRYAARIRQRGEKS